MRHFAQRAALGLLRAYKWAISPMFPPACRYVPTCSEYAMEAIERFGVLRGGLMAMARLLRCHPLTHGGYDPVVEVDTQACDKAWEGGALWKSGALREGGELSKGGALWKSGASAPRQSANFLSGFSPCEHLKRNS